MRRRRRMEEKRKRESQEKGSEIKEKKNVAQRTFWTATLQFSYDADV
jgi:hypothetical protein